MLGIVLNLPPAVEQYVATTPVFEMASHALLVFGWIPIFGVLVWGFTQVWVDYKQGQYLAHIDWVVLNISIPQGAINTPKGMELFFNNLAGAKSAITWKEAHLIGKFQAFFSFEIVGIEGDVKFYIRTPEKYRDLVEASLYSQYPEAQILEVEDYVDHIPDKYPNDKVSVFGSEMKLSKPQHYPIRTYSDFEHEGEKDQRFKDPLLSVIEVMGKMHHGESMWMQVVIMPPDEQDWAKEGEKYLNKMMGKEEKHTPSLLGQAAANVAWLPNEVLKQTAGLDFMGGEHHDEKKDDFRMFKLTPTERAVADAIAEKISKIGWYTKIRIVYCGPNDHFNHRKGLIAAMIKGMFHPFAHLNMNKLGMHDHATPKDDYFWLVWQIYHRMEHLVHRYKKRQLGAGTAPFVLNSEELATLFHFPAADARTPILAHTGARRAEAPLALPFAHEDDPDLPDWRQLVKGGHGGGHGAHGADHGHADVHGAHEHEEEHGVLTVPTPHAPTGSAAHTPTAHRAAVDSHSPVSSHRAADAAPTPSTAHHAPADDFMPQPGRPAPLPPGMNFAAEPISDDDDAPPNLPVL